MLCCAQIMTLYWHVGKNLASDNVINQAAVLFMCVCFFVGGPFPCLRAAATHMPAALSAPRIAFRFVHPPHGWCPQSEHKLMLTLYAPRAAHLQLGSHYFFRSGTALPAIRRGMELVADRTLSDPST